jgi:hypothetical protein
MLKPLQPRAKIIHYQVVIRSQEWALKCILFMPALLLSADHWPTNCIQTSHITFEKMKLKLLFGQIGKSC